MRIKRARGHRLYTVEGKRIIDLSMDRSRGVIGHRPNGLSLTLKNSIDRGIYASYDNVYTGRLKKYLKKSFPEYSTLTVLSHEDRVRSYFNEDIADPLLDDTTDRNVAYWRPFLETPDTNHLVILYPVPGLNNITLLLSRESIELKSENVSPVLLSGILRSLYDYEIEKAKFRKEDFYQFNEIENTTLEPPYLVLKKSDKEYEDLKKKGLEIDILLNDQTQIQVLSLDFSKGEVNKILELLT